MKLALVTEYQSIERVTIYQPAVGSVGDCKIFLYVGMVQQTPWLPRIVKEIYYMFDGEIP